ncbi:IucA/IucC family protein, partial [Staphylococcus aureus]
HILPNVFATEISEKLVVLLPLKFGDYLSSSSMRSLIDIGAPYNHVKVPFAMQSLGALRLTPTRYMKNGEQAEQLLRQLIEKDEALAKVCHRFVIEHSLGGPIWVKIMIFSRFN